MPSFTLFLSVGSTTSYFYIAGSQSTVDWPSAPASRGVKYSGASEPAHSAHGFCTACSFCVLNRPSVIYWCRIQGECETSLDLLLFVSFMFSLFFFSDIFTFALFLWKLLFCVGLLSQITFVLDHSNYTIKL